ncbi:Os06g0190000 [Oryza sativa Japonica Group]|uniref:Os06g0190000 protein n=1 Tax=Oryza sativa subsp. japonica TaxID=39947 RepID=A0A0P0WTV5_ORYSJ|nr:Os06g0190000 [Oryza sativa Japonica Group]
MPHITQGVTGYCIDVFEAAMKKLPNHLSYEFVVFNGSYDQLVQSVSSGVKPYSLCFDDIVTEPNSYTISAGSYYQINDAAVGDITITADRASQVEFTMPYTESGVSMLVLAKNESESTTKWSYGASLASILTVKRFQPSVTDLDQLLCNGDYVGYQEGSFVHSFLTRRGFSEGRLRSYSKKQEYAESLRKGSKNGGVSAIVDEIPFLTAIVSDPHYENEFQMLKRIYKTPGFGFVFPPGFPLVHNLSTAMLDVTSGDEGSQAVSPSNAIPNTDSTPLTLQSFSGLFIIYGFMSALMLMISISMSVLAQYTKIRVSDVQSPGVDDGNGAHEGSNQAQNSMGNGFVADRPLREIRIDDSSQDIHGSV